MVGCSPFKVCLASTRVASGPQPPTAGCLPPSSVCDAVAAPAPEEHVAPVITNIQAEKLTGPKILGKIELPVDSDTRPKKESLEEKHKRKRIPIQKKPGAPQRGPAQFDPLDRSNRNNQGTGGGRFNRPGQAPARREDKVIDAKPVGNTDDGTHIPRVLNAVERKI